MRQTLLTLLFLFPALLIPSVVFGEVSVHVDAPSRAGAGARVEWTLVAKNNGPDEATIDIQTGFDDRVSTCFYARVLEPGEEVALPCYMQAPQNAGRYRIVANTRTGNVFPFPPRVQTFAEVDVVLAPDVAMTFDGSWSALRGGRVFYSAGFEWYEPVVPSPPAVLTVRLDPRLTLVKVPSPCTHDAAANVLVCAIAGSGAPDRTYFGIEAVAPSEGTGEPLITYAEVTTDDPLEVTENLNSAVAVTATYKTFTVTTPADSGEGSLRAAIENANAECDRAPLCEIAFAIDAPQARWHTIRLQSPLPRLVATGLLLDGSSQAAVHGDTNSEGPEIEISGIRLGEGDGIVVDAACGSTVRGLSILGFPGAGLRLTGSRRCRGVLGVSRLVQDNFLGTNATGAFAIGNQRGLVIESGGGWSVRKNVISGNHRTGLFLWSGQQSLISGNRIGLRAHDDLPLGNGGSGIFLGPAAMGTDLENNHVAFNRETGVAVAASYVGIGSNSIHANGLLGIDVGLDGPGGSDAPPRITSAIYDPVTRLTTIEGVGTSVGSFGPDEVLVFANDACDGTGGEGQNTLGRVSPTRPSNTFRFVHSGDLTGKFITATTTIRQCINCFTASSVESEGINFGVYTRTTEFSECSEVVRKP